MSLIGSEFGGFRGQGTWSATKDVSKTRQELWIKDIAVGAAFDDGVGKRQCEALVVSIGRD